MFARWVDTTSNPVGLRMKTAVARHLALDT